jgi:signal transduction histidine kinase
MIEKVYVNFRWVLTIEDNFSVKKSFNDGLILLNEQLKNNNITSELTGEDFTIYGHKSEFAQVVTIIINNAKDAILEKAKNSPSFKGEIKVSLNKTEDLKIITIQDNGGGIDKKYKEKIFDPYFTTKFQSKGAGIGLYMVKNIIVNNMSGTIGVENYKDGALFTLTF